MMDTPEQEISNLQEELKDINERLSLFLDCYCLFTSKTPQQIAAHKDAEMGIYGAIAKLERLKEAMK